MRKDILRSPFVAVVRDKKNTHKKRGRRKKILPSSRVMIFFIGATTGDQKIKKAEQKRDKKRQKKENFLLCFLTLEGEPQQEKVLSFPVRTKKRRKEQSSK